MELYWRGDDLKFQVHLKPNQILKYLNKGSSHTNACTKAIPAGVLRRLAILTSPTPETENMPLNQLYPKHTAALQKSKLISPDFEFPTLQEALKQIQQPADPPIPETPSVQSNLNSKKRKRQSQDHLVLHWIQPSLGDPNLKKT